ncbi:MAG: hypothetical protein QG657_821 [Acidobacteriota bacterium]|nr:hypothetical protein [Acidobacteriota bacterium]
MKHIPLFKVFMSKTAGSIVQKTLYSGYIGQGIMVERFENMLREYLNVNNLVTTNSATSALHLAIHLIKNNNNTEKQLKPDIQYKNNNNFVQIFDYDEVLATPLTCVATNFPILANRLNIRWVDVSSSDLNISLSDLRVKLSPKTKLIVLVHWGGYPVELNNLKSLLDETEINLGFRPVVIEDCAHAFGSIYDSKFIGGHGNYCVFSFQAIKQLTTSDGGLLIVPNDIQCKRARKLRWYGLDRDLCPELSRYERDIEEWGFKFHMNDVMASIGIANLPNISFILDQQRANAEYYNKELEKVGSISLLNNNQNRKSSYFLYTVLVEKRKEFEKWMNSCGIEVRRPHKRNDLHSCMNKYRVELPTLNSIYENITCIPAGWWVGEQERDYIVSCIKKGW